MKRAGKYTDLINKLTNVLAKKVSPSVITSAAQKFLRECLLAEKSEFFIWDTNNILIKDFISDWRMLDDEEQTEYINVTYNNLIQQEGVSFYFNGESVKCDLTDYKEITQEYCEKINCIIFPMTLNGQVLGFLKTQTELQNFTKEYFIMLNTVSKLITGAVMNYLLNEQMEISLNFYRAMKDIAKIIESQYELSYIIPMIGEMIDRFMSSHLIYIFIKEESGYKLVWPGACKDANVYKMLEKLKDEREYILSEDKRIGVFPLISDDITLGAVVAYGNIERLTEKETDYLSQLTKQSGLTIQRANVYAEVLKYATIDALTGLNNRRQFEIRLSQEVANSKRNNTPLCAMMIDVDYFKKVNDTYGHAAGDCVLKNAAGVIKNEIREYDTACRYGGEEFFIILPQTNIKKAAAVAQRLRKVMEETKMDIREADVEGVKNIKITVSIGVCEYDGVSEPEAFAQKADKALYEAKSRGRNRVIVF